MRTSDSMFVQVKVTPAHLPLFAYIYIRQSSPGQVKHNLESQRYQYQLAERAEMLGWSKEQIRIVDSDQGVTASSSEHRDGYKEMVADVSLGRVGIIFGYEVSRMARRNSDWYALLDVAAVFGTLIADADGIYDPRLYNDRMLLGLKGAISEAELHLIKSRLEQGRMLQVERGEYRQRLPTGLVRMPDGSVVKDPDEHVCHTIDLVFAKFKELRSCGRVLRYFVRENIRLPRYQTSGRFNRQLVWKPAVRSAIYDMICNPAYAGAFVYGRRQSDPANQILRPSRGHIRRDPGEWEHVKQGVYPSFITWEQFQQNQARLRELGALIKEDSEGAREPAREGTALLQGLGFCGQCGLRMQVNYSLKAWYFCSTGHETGLASCPSIPGPSADRAVEQAFFEAILPTQLDALEAVLAAQEEERGKLERQWCQRIERARYEADLADGRFHEADYKNRLVAAELERRWEDKLQELRSAEQEYENFLQRRKTVKPEFREQFRHISETLPALWEESQISPSQKKDMLRCLISRVVLMRPLPERLKIRIVWKSGHYWSLNAYAPVMRWTDISNYPEMVERTRVLWQQGINDTTIAARLTEEGFCTARTESFSAQAVYLIRRKNGLRPSACQQ